MSDVDGFAVLVLVTIFVASSGSRWFARVNGDAPMTGHARYQLLDRAPRTAFELIWKANVRVGARLLAPSTDVRREIARAVTWLAAASFVIEFVAAPFLFKMTLWAERRRRGRDRLWRRMVPRIGSRSTGLRAPLARSFGSGHP